MIVIKTLKWSHAFSYGADNCINFSDSNLIQLVGKNGHGKTSIALILEEVLFNKNSKGIKRNKILNRYSGSKKYSIEVVFDKDGRTYNISTVRGATQTVTILIDGKDCSQHTATATYKMIEDILGMDHKTFTQLVYQSNAFSLEFLTAPDTARKKFLMQLMRLNKYSVALEHYKDVQKTLQKELAEVDAKLAVTNRILAKSLSADLVLKELLEVPTIDRSLEDKIAQIKVEIPKIEATNAAITKNNTYKRLLSDISLNPAEPPEDSTNITIEISEVTKKLAVLEKVASGANTLLTKCPSCGQSIDNSHKKLMAEEAKAEIPGLKVKLKALQSAKLTIDSDKAKYNKYVEDLANWEKYHALINNQLISVPIEASDLLNELNKTQKLLQTQRLAYESAVKTNVEINNHNSRVEVIKNSIEAAQIEKADLELMRKDISDRLGLVQLLVKAFSVTGLPAYKIECMVRELEVLTNEYLLSMSDGRFQLGFGLTDSDKLDVVITDNGTDIDINALSNGELARVNVSTLLAIRKYMQSLSDNKVNLLFMDETLGSLDDDGKERLVEVLSTEADMNIVLVSHSFTHPLIEKVYINKKNNVSRIAGG